MVEMMTGFCRVCGTGQTIAAETQEEADQKATETCNCAEGKAERLRLEFRKQIRESAAEHKAKEITPLDDETLRIVLELADLVIAGRLKGRTGNRNQENSKRIEIQPQEETGGHN